MDWANERYVRLYTRDTADDLVLSWQAQGLWPLLLRKADRAGVIATNHGARGIAALVRWPAEVVAIALPELLEDGRIRACTEPPGYVIPNYLPAQETPSSDAQRKRDERERRREGANNSVTERDSDVTKRDQKSRAVTRGHAESRAVTPSLAVPVRSDPSRAEPSEVGSVSAAPPLPRSKAKPIGTPEELESVRVVLERLSERSGVQYRGGVKHTALVVSRLREGVTEWDLRRVVAYCAERLGWETDPKMRAYLRPETLFGPQTLEKYLDAARAWAPGGPEDYAGKPETSRHGALSAPPALRLLTASDDLKFELEAEHG